MARVAMLAHVKETAAAAVPAPVRASTRIPWSGGKIVSNKDEALRKFYERKLQRGGTLSPEQARALEAAVANMASVHTPNGDKKREHQHRSKHDVVHHHHINPKKKHLTHRAHAKVQASARKTLVVNGRVVGPRVHVGNGASSSSPSLTSSRPAKDAKRVKVVRPNKPLTTGLALQDKLEMSLDALVKRNKQ